MGVIVSKKENQKIIHQNCPKTKKTNIKSHILIKPGNPNFDSPHQSLLNDIVISYITLIINIPIILNVMILQATLLT